MTHTILFVCTGNVCRSPMAEALFNARARGAGESDQYVARSAGTWALENQPASGHAITAMANRGVDLSAHRGRTVTREMLHAASVIIVMTRNHLEALASEFPGERRKLHLMTELKGSAFDIADPYGGTFEEYEHTAQELEDLIDRGYDQIITWTNNGIPPS